MLPVQIPEADAFFKKAVAAGAEVKMPLMDQFRGDGYGPKWMVEDNAYTRGIQDGHITNIRKMAATGKLIVAGPFSDNGDLRGVFIFMLKSVDEDPAVKAGRLVDLPK